MDSSHLMYSFRPRGVFSECRISGFKKNNPIWKIIRDCLTKKKKKTIDGRFYSVRFIFNSPRRARLLLPIPLNRYDLRVHGVPTENKWHVNLQVYVYTYYTRARARVYGDLNAPYRL